MNESCHTYEWVMSHIWMSHVTQMNESCHTYEWVMSYIWMSHVTHMNESCHTYEWVMSHIRMSQVTQVSYMAILYCAFSNSKRLLKHSQKFENVSKVSCTLISHSTFSSEKRCLLRMSAFRDFWEYLFAEFERSFLFWEWVPFATFENVYLRNSKDLSSFANESLSRLCVHPTRAL